MTTIRPIDEELTRLHHPIITENDDMDEYDVSLFRCSCRLYTKCLYYSDKHSQYLICISLCHDQALEGFTVASSGSVMIPSGAFSNPHLYRQRSISSHINSSYGSMGSYPASYVVYDGQHQAMMYAQFQSLPRSQPSYSSSLTNSFPSSLPKSYSHQQYDQQRIHVPQAVYPSYEYPPRYPQQGMNGW